MSNEVILAHTSPIRVSVCETYFEPKTRQEAEF